MAVADIFGSTGMTKVNTGIVYTIENGLSTVETYEGPTNDADALEDEFRQQVNEGSLLTYRRRNTSGFVQIMAFYPTDADGENAATVENETWNLIPQDLEKPLRAYDGAIPSTQAFNLDAHQKALEKVRQAWERAEDYTPAAEPMITYQKLLFRHVTSYIRTAVILRNVVKIAANNAEISASWENVDRALTLEDTGFDATDANNAAILGSINTMPEADASLKQWLKRGPQMQPLGNNKYSLMQDYWFARGWSANMYAGSEAP